MMSSENYLLISLGVFWLIAVWVYFPKLKSKGLLFHVLVNAAYVYFFKHQMDISTNSTGQGMFIGCLCFIIMHVLVLVGYKLYLIWDASQQD